MSLTQLAVLSVLFSCGVCDNTLTLFRQTKTLTPNERLTKCCVDQHTISETCMSLCNYNQFSKAEVLKVLVRRSCAVEELHDLLQCSARWVDHTKCCAAKGVAQRCLDFCRPAFQQLSAAPANFVCFRHIQQIRQCFLEYDEENLQYAA